MCVCDDIIAWCMMWVYVCMYIHTCGPRLHCIDIWFHLKRCSHIS